MNNHTCIVCGYTASLKCGYNASLNNDTLSHKQVYSTLHPQGYGQPKVIQCVLCGHEEHII